jgi:BirA family transcriptional regulator, biotin operon repressor / biotin---[acetyl-CoA-carboxylase] ligase
VTGCLRPVPLGRTIHRLGAVTSTQDEAAKLAGTGAAEGTVVTATHQRAGRGRRSRQWLDVPGESLLMSVVLRPPIAPSTAPQLSLVAAVAVVDALKTAGVRAAIRWPNDVMVAERKICGILPEAATARQVSLEHVILGLGLNVNQRDFPGPLGALATSVRIETGRAHPIEEMLGAVLVELEGWYARFLREGLAGERGVGGLRTAWLERAQSIGRRSRAADGREGIAVGLAEDGALLLKTDGGETVRVFAGEVTPEALHAAGH